MMHFFANQSTDYKNTLLLTSLQSVTLEHKPCFQPERNLLIKQCYNNKYCMQCLYCKLEAKLKGITFSMTEIFGVSILQCL